MSAQTTYLVRVGSSGRFAGAVGIIEAQPGAATTDTDIEETLITSVLPAGAFDIDDYINGARIRVFGLFLNNANLKTLRVRMNGSLILTLADTYNNGKFIVDIEIIGDASNQTYVIESRVAIGGVIDLHDIILTATALDGTADNTITITGQNDVSANPNDIVILGYSLEYRNSVIPPA